MRFFFAILCLIISSGAMASHTIDSIGVENQNGNQVILHKVQAKETYYSIARLYHVPPRAIIELNNNVALRIGSIVKVPTSRPFSSAAASANTASGSSRNDNIIDYRVGAREYLYSIARRFNTTVEDIRKLNNLRSDNLSIGQILKVRQGQTATEPVVTESVTASEETEPEPEKPRIPTNRLGLSERSEKGVAVWITDENLDGSKMLALHRTAPIGTVVKVTNPMTDRVTFAKVVGKFTENETTKDVIIVLTKATADLLGALDKRFQVTIDYGVPNE